MLRIDRTRKYPSQLWDEQLCGTMTFDELCRRCVRLSRAMGLRHATFIIAYKADCSVIYSVMLSGYAGWLKKRRIDLKCERIYLNPEWSFDDLIHSREKIVDDIDCQMVVTNLPFFHRCASSVFHRSRPGSTKPTSKLARLLR